MTQRKHLTVEVLTNYTFNSEGSLMKSLT